MMPSGLAKSIVRSAASLSGHPEHVVIVNDAECHACKLQLAFWLTD